MTNEEALVKAKQLFGDGGYVSYNSTNLSDAWTHYVCDSTDLDLSAPEGVGNSYEEAFEDMYTNFPKLKRI